MCEGSNAHVNSHAAGRYDFKDEINRSFDLFKTERNSLQRLFEVSFEIVRFRRWRSMLEE